MRVRGTALSNPALFARKGEATAEGFQQPQARARRGLPLRVRRALLVLALPVAYLSAATLAIMSLELGGDRPARAVPEISDRAAAPPPPRVAAGAPATTSTPAPPTPPPSNRPVADRPVAALPPLKPVPAALGVPPAPPLKPVSVGVAGTPGKKLEPASESPGAMGRYRVQLASLASAEAVRREWTRLKTAHGNAFEGLRLMVEPSPSGAYYRLQAGPVASLSAARKLCAKLRRSRAGCLVVAR